MLTKLERCKVEYANVWIFPSDGVRDSLKSMWALKVERGGLENYDKHLQMGVGESAKYWQPLKDICWGRKYNMKITKNHQPVEELDKC